METWIILVVFLVINLIHTLINLFFLWTIRRKETFAVVAGKDGHNTIHKINPHLSHFKFEKMAYVIPPDVKEYTVKIGNKMYIRYIQNTPEPHKWWNDEKPVMYGDVFHSIIENEGLKLLNKPPMAFNWMMIGIIAVVLIIAYLIFGHSAAPAVAPATG